MKRTKRNNTNWPMQYILGGIFLTALVVLLTYGLQSMGPDTDAVTSIASMGDPVEDARNLDRAEEESLIDVVEATDDTPMPETEPVIIEDETPQIPAEPMTYAEAEELYESGAYAEAAAGFASYLTVHPDNPWGLYMRGLSHWRAGDAEAAETCLRDVLADHPDLIKARYNLCRVLMTLEKHEDALALIDPATDDAVAQRLRGRALHNLDRRDDALRAYRLALHLDPTDAWALNNLGLILIEENRHEEALGALALAVTLDDAVPCFRNNLGVVLENLGHPAAAADAYAAGLTLNPDYGKAAVNLARVEGIAMPADAAPLDLARVADAYAAILSGDEAPVATAEVEAPAEEPAGETGSAMDVAGTEPVEVSAGGF